MRYDQKTAQFVADSENKVVIVVKRATDEIVYEAKVTADQSEVMVKTPCEGDYAVVLIDNKDRPIAGCYSHNVHGLTLTLSGPRHNGPRPEEN